MISIRFLTKNLFSILLTAGLVLLLVFAQPIAASVSRGLSICLNTLIPSLFVFMIIADFTVRTGVIDWISRPFGILCAKLFHIDASFGTLLIMSLICGYPVGAKLLADQVASGKLSKDEASRMLAFCVNAGPAFIIGSVSVPIFGSAKLGFFLFLSHLIAFFAVGIVSGIKRKAFTVNISQQKTGYTNGLVDAVSSSCKAMLNICAFVLLFSGIIGLLELIGVIPALASLFNPSVPQELTQAGIYGMLEVSNGILLCKGLPSAFLLAAAITAFGGLCVQFQIQSIVGKRNISMKYFYLYRPLYIFVSVLMAWIFSHLCHPAMQTMIVNSSTIPQTTSSTPLASVFLIVLSASLLLCDKKSGTILDNQKIKRR